MQGYVLSDDLLFTSRITGFARHFGLSVRQARTIDDLRRLAGDKPPVCVFLDLQHEGLDLGPLIAELRPPGAPRPRFVGYGSHVDVRALRAAREAGCDEVMPNSQFVAELPLRMPEWFDAATPPEA